MVAEGAIVKKDDFLIQFDDTAVKQRLIEQETLVATDDAAVIEARSETKRPFRRSTNMSMARFRSTRRHSKRIC
ncbi:MAG: hypothetical protein CM1200mP2_33980 [Planctomycetaceae bacterium]|nr:MAG: hypothetical protein CM1200mP2_33980 [Planctomycetaceae bacterium]